MLTYTGDKYIKHYAENDMVLTEWKEGDDILNFSFCKIAICPLNKVCEWREITQEECDRLQAELENKLIEMERSNGIQG